MTPSPSDPLSPPKRHVPERTCVACRKKRPQGELLRLTLQGKAWALQGRRRTGRGVYVCADTPECWQEKGLRRIFRAQAAAVSELLRATLPTGHFTPSESSDSPP